MTRDDFNKKLHSIVQGWVGVPFVHHGRVRSQGVDCLGLIICIFDELGVDFPTDKRNYIYKEDWYIHHRESVYLTGLLERGIQIPKHDALPGDLHYFKPGLLTRARIDRVSHGGIHVGEWDGPNKFVHSFRNYHGSTITSLDQRAWRESYAGTIRLHAVIALLEE